MTLNKSGGTITVGMRSEAVLYSGGTSIRCNDLSVLMMMTAIARACCAAQVCQCRSQCAELKGGVVAGGTDVAVHTFSGNMHRPRLTTTMLPLSARAFSSPPPPSRRQPSSGLASTIRPMTGATPALPINGPNFAAKKSNT